MRKLTLLTGIITGHLFFWALLSLAAVYLQWDWGILSTQGADLMPLMSAYGMVFNALIFYGNAFYLYPRRRQRLGGLPYWFLVLAALVLLSLTEAGIDMAVARRLGAMAGAEELLLQEQVPRLLIPFVVFVDQFISVLTIHFLYWVLSMAYLLPLENYRNRRQQARLERERMVAELNFLRAQINPHFLFNGINSVYHLIDRDPALAKDALMKFSGLLRYQLYDCTEEYIPLERELQHCQHYLALAALRMGNEVRLEVDIELPDGSWSIAPLLLLPFLENACKYVSRHSEAERNWIELRLWMEPPVLHLELKNSVEEEMVKQEGVGGIGLENVSKRLELLYPHRHLLVHGRKSNHYFVNLQINLA